MVDNWIISIHKVAQTKNTIQNIITDNVLTRFINNDKACEIKYIRQSFSLKCNLWGAENKL